MLTLPRKNSNITDLTISPTNGEVVSRLYGGALSFGYLPPGGTSKTIIVQLNVSDVAWISNIKFSITSIPFEIGLEFKVGVLDYLDEEFEPEDVFTGIDFGTRGEYSIPIKNISNTKSQYVYLRAECLPNANIGTGVIFYNWKFEHDKYLESIVPEISDTGSQMPIYIRLNSAFYKPLLKDYPYQIASIPLCLTKETTVGLDGGVIAAGGTLYQARYSVLKNSDGSMDLNNGHFEISAVVKPSFSENKWSMRILTNNLSVEPKLKSIAVDFEKKDDPVTPIGTWTYVGNSVDTLSVNNVVNKLENVETIDMSGLEFNVRKITVQEFNNCSTDDNIIPELPPENMSTPTAQPNGSVYVPPFFMKINGLNNIFASAKQVGTVLGGIYNNAYSPIDFESFGGLKFSGYYKCPPEYANMIRTAQNQTICSPSLNCYFTLSQKVEQSGTIIEDQWSLVIYVGSLFTNNNSLTSRAIYELNNSTTANGLYNLVSSEGGKPEMASIFPTSIEISVLSLDEIKTNEETLKSSYPATIINHIGMQFFE